MFCVLSELMIPGIVGLFCLANILWLLSVLLVACCTFWKIMFTSTLKFLSSLYLLSSASQLNVGCFMIGLPSLVPMFCVLSALATAMACIDLVVSATTCTIGSFASVCSFTIICIYTLSAYVCLYETFYSCHHVVFLALVKITPVDAYMCIYCYSMNLWVSMYLHVSRIIYIVMCTLVDYIHHAYWLWQLYDDGCASYVCLAY